MSLRGASYETQQCVTASRKRPDKHWQEAFWSRKDAQPSWYHQGIWKLPTQVTSRLLNLQMAMTSYFWPQAHTKWSLLCLLPLTPDHHKWYSKYVLCDQVASVPGCSTLPFLHSRQLSKLKPPNSTLTAMSPGLTIPDGCGRQHSFIWESLCKCSGLLEGKDTTAEDRSWQGFDFFK